MPSRAKERITGEVTRLVLARKPKQCNFLEYQGTTFPLSNPTAHLSRVIRLDSKVIYRRYASLYFVCAVTAGENELNALEIMHRYVETLDSHFGNASLFFVPAAFIEAYHPPFFSRSPSLICESPTPPVNSGYLNTLASIFNYQIAYAVG